MSDYQQGKIYKITCKETWKVYIGSTVQSLYNRMRTHRCKNNTCASREIIERGNYEVELIENFPCDTERELHTREQYWIDNTENTINIKRHYESDEAYLEHEKARAIEYARQYRNENKDMLKQKREQYLLKNKAVISAKKSEVIQCECGGSYTRNHKARHCRTRKHLDNLPA